ncbi:MAG TPA: hypothetical protein VFY55_09930 [Nitrososphaeraceae archaeon]|nr:hypothetical protein [Nitrososphaeraceae archaeon]
MDLSHRNNGTFIVVQGKTMEFSVAFWNLQNLFDVNSSEIATDLEFIPEKG